MINRCEKYTDETKILTIIKNVKDNLLLQKDINYISGWSLTWSMDLKIEKCCVMHIDTKNPCFDFTIYSRDCTRKLTKTTLEKDLGIYFQNNLKWTSLIKYCTTRGNRILGMIAKSFNKLSIYSLKMLYTALVRPHL